MTGSMGAAILAAALLAGGCSKDHKDTGQDTSPYVYRDTAEVRDTGEDTGEPQDTGEPGPAWSALRLYPEGLEVARGAALEIRLVASGPDGPVDIPPAEASLSSTPSTVASISGNGLVEALGVGVAHLTATWGGLEAETTLTVGAEGLILLDVVDADTGEPIPGAQGNTGAEEEVVVDADAAGVITLSSSDTTHTVSAWAEGYAPLTVHGAVATRLTMPLRRLSEPATFGGDVDFSGVTGAGYGEVVLGLAAASLRHHPLFFQVEDLVGPDRDATLWGIEVALPGNLFLEGQVEDYQGQVSPGPTGVWSLAGPVPVSDLTAALDGTLDILSLLEHNLEGFRYGWSGACQAEAGAHLVVDVAPSRALDVSVEVAVPELPEGFTGGEKALVMLHDHVPEAGYALVGLGAGVGSVTARRAPAEAARGGASSHAVAAAQVGGLGSGAAMVLSWSPVESDQVTLPPFQAVPSVGGFDGGTRAWAVSTDPRATLARVTITDPEGSERDLLLPGGAVEGTLPRLGISYGYGRTSWTLVALELGADTFQGLVSRGGATEGGAAELVTTVAAAGASF